MKNKNKLENAKSLSRLEMSKLLRNDMNMVVGGYSAGSGYNGGPGGPAADVNNRR